MSSDFLEIFLPKPPPVLSVDALTGFRIDDSGKCETLRDSIVSPTCPLGWTRLLPFGSACLPLETIGDDCLLGRLAVGVSMFPFTVKAAPGLDLPAESGLSGKVVRRFGGVSSEKSGGTIGCDGGRTRGLGELGRDRDGALRPFDIARPVEIEGPGEGDIEGAELRRVGVDGLEADRMTGEVRFAGICGLEFGVEGLEFWDGLDLSMEEVVGAGRALEGVEDRDGVEREDAVEGRAVDEERVVGVEGLM